MIEGDSSGWVADVKVLEGRSEGLSPKSLKDCLSTLREVLVLLNSF